MVNIYFIVVLVLDYIRLAIIILMAVLGILFKRSMQNMQIEKKEQIVTPPDSERSA
jgi:hypothetical protein